ncbi:serine protease inhibitor 42Dd-like [Musca autumnalis]|uniref:serine protease inhibitor 42Dd-like n=1 Tax=Musca autumnalis TaxID=221902 RepID=UPI003CFAE381
MAITNSERNSSLWISKLWKFFLIAVTCLHLAAAQCSTPECEAFLHGPNQPRETTERPFIRDVATTPAPVRIYFPDETKNLKIPSEYFDAKLFQFMSRSAKDQNFCISPLSVQILLTFLSTVSEGKLHDELSQLLNLPNNETLVAQTYQKLIKVSTENSDANNTIIIANKLYYDERYGILQKNIRDKANDIYATDLETVDFLMPTKASDKINFWVADRTRHLINNICTPDSIRSDTMALLINTLYFKSEWEKKFALYDTDMRPFKLNRQTQILVETMYTEDVFRYGEFEHLEATVLEIPYKLNDFSMMIILPNDIEGLPEVEKRLTETTLKLISFRLNQHEVIAKIPKFNIEFDVDMIPTLQQLGLHSLFNNESSINIFKHKSKPLVVDQMRHKTVINVNEAGTEAAATTFAKIVPLSIPVGLKRFTADHPFIFVIRNSNAVYFMGHVVKLKENLPPVYVFRNENVCA